MQAPSGEQWGQLWLPLWPYASDELYRGIYRMGRDEALDHRYIEANPQALSNLLVVDIDHPDAFLRAVEDRDGHIPNSVVENSSNGQAHAVWGMAEPITRTEYAHRKPLAYMAAVVEGLRRSVGGDKGYSGLMTKNPVHTDWDAAWLTDRLYSLDELAEHLRTRGFMPPASWHRTKRRTPVGLGRNCTIFETARTWAYREVRKCPDRSPASSRWLYEAISGQVHGQNAGFTEPLPAGEAEGIAASIHRWITTRSRMWLDGAAVYEATFTTIQSARGRKSGQARRTARKQAAQTRQAIWEALNVEP